jgi:DNA adenine methylase
VPPGRYDNPKIVDRALLAAVSTALTTLDIRVRQAPYDRLLDDARAGDFAYFDPPYAPLSKTANFRGYTGRGFSGDDQQRLQQLLIELSRRGVHVLLSNSTAASVTALYEGNAAAKAAGLRTWRFPARRAVNSNATRRGVVEELVVSNIRPRRGDADRQGMAARVLTS